MQADIETIVDFERPPVVEVVLGIQMDRPVVDLEVLADFAVMLKPEYPNRSQTDPIGRTTEVFARPPDPPRIEFRFGGGPLPRTLFSSLDQRFLIQLQSDRLTLNWRRVTIGDAYPRFASLRPRFDHVRLQLRKVFQDLGREMPVVDHVEVTYINELSFDDKSPPDRHPELADMLTTITSVRSDGFLPPPEDSGYGARFRIPSVAGGGDAGRLLVSTESAYRAPDRTPIYLLRLTASLVGPAPTEESVIEMLNLGRSWVVNGFVQLTSSDIQATWGPMP